MNVRDRTILVVICVVGVIAAGWLLVVSPKRTEATQLQGQINTQQAKLSSVRAQLAAGNAARAAFAASYASLVRLGEAVPTDDDTPSLIYQLQSAAKATGVDFQGLTFNAGGSGAPPPTPTPTGATPSASSTSAAQSATATLPPGATVGPAGFPIEPFTFTFTGNFFHLANFFGRLQKFVVATNKRLAVSGRLMTLNAINLGPSTTGFPQITASIGATTFLLPASQGLTAGATPAGPATSTTQTVSTPRSSSPAPAAVVTPPVVR